MIGRAFVGFAVAAAAFAVGSCYLAETPGTGSRAATGYRAAAPVIVALEAFHRQHDHYPRALQELVPRYLDAAELTPATHVGNDHAGGVVPRYLVCRLLLEKKKIPI